jgi:hypothetical protein
LLGVVPDELLVSRSAETFEITEEVDSLEDIGFSLGIVTPKNIQSGIGNDLSVPYVSEMAQRQTVEVHNIVPFMKKAFSKRLFSLLFGVLKPHRHYHC